MQTLCFILATILLLTVGAGFWRAVRGPSPADRMLAVQMISTTTVAILQLLAYALKSPGLRDIALILALLAAVTAVAFVRRSWPQEEIERDAS